MPQARLKWKFEDFKGLGGSDGDGQEMGWKMRRWLVPVGDWDFSWYPGSDPSWYAVVWLARVCVVWLASACARARVCDWKPNSSVVLGVRMGWGEWKRFTTHTPVSAHQLVFTEGLSSPTFPSFNFSPHFYSPLCYSVSFPLFLPLPFLLCTDMMSMWWSKSPFCVFLILQLPAL